MEKKGNAGIRELIKIFEKVFKDIPDHLEPTNAQILDNFIESVGGHLTYQLRDKKPKTLVEAKEIVIEVEQNLNVARIECLNLLGLKRKPRRANPWIRLKKPWSWPLRKLTNYLRTLVLGT